MASYNLLLQFFWLTLCILLPVYLTPLRLILKKCKFDSIVKELTNKLYINKMVLEPNVSPHKQIIKDDDVKECISIE